MSNANLPEDLQKVQEAFGLADEDVATVYQEMVQDEQDRHPKLDEDKQTKRAIRRTYLHFKRRNVGQGNIGVEGIFIATSDAVDLNGRKIRDARELYARNPQLAVKKGLTDESGTPIDSRKTFPDGSENKSFGKPLTPKMRYIAQGIFTWDDHDEPTLMTLYLNGNGNPPPLYKRVGFRATRVNESDDPDRNGIINVSDDVNFDVLADVDMSQVVGQMLPEFVSDISGLEDYVEDSTQERPFVIVEGDVSRMFLNPDGDKSRSIQIEDDSLGYDDYGLNVWLADHIVVDYAEDSRVIVFGTASVNPDYGANLNANGVWAVPEFKIEVDADLSEYGEDDF